MSNSKDGKDSKDTIDELYTLTEEEQASGLRSIEPLRGSRTQVIVRFDVTPIMVNLANKEWATKLKTDAKDVGINEKALSVAKRRLHLIESETYVEISEEQSDNSGNNKKLLDPLSLGEKESDSEKLIHLLETMHHEIFLDQHSHAFIIAKSFAGKLGNNTIGADEPIELLDKDFVEYATGLFYDATNQIIHTNDVTNVATILSHRAKRKNIDPDTGDIIVRPLYVRVAWADANKRDTIYIDIADTKRHIIAIKAGEGFKVISQSDAPIMFRRQNRLPLPLPAEKYDDDIAEQFLDLYQIPKDAYYKRLMAKVLMAIRMIPLIPHPLEILYGSKGGLKSSWCEGQKNLIDPSTTTTLTIPDTEDNFSLQAYHNYVLVYDNIKPKNVPKWFPDALCRSVYQQDTEKRQHYSNMKTVSYSAGGGCALINGINKMFQEEDVLDRSVLSEWHRLKPGQFKTKVQVKQEYDRIRPQLLGCLCDKVSAAIAMYDQVEQEIESKFSRMADFMLLGECISRAFGYKSDEFIEAYNTNLELQN